MERKDLNYWFEILERDGDTHFFRVALQNGLVNREVLIGDVDNEEVFETLIQSGSKTLLLFLHVIMMVQFAVFSL